MHGLTRHLNTDPDKHADSDFGEKLSLDDASRTRNAARQLTTAQKSLLFCAWRRPGPHHSQSSDFPPVHREVTLYCDLYFCLDTGK